MLTSIAWLWLAAQSTTPVTAKSDPLLAEAAQAASNFQDSLPDFLCRQEVRRTVVTRALERHHTVDTVEAEVAFEGGAETLRSLLRNKVPVKQEADLLQFGMWSRGEWGRALQNVFGREVAATFFDGGPYSMRGSRGRKYEFAVRAAQSRWNIFDGTRTTRPAYAGTVWIDTRSRRVTRIEMRAVAVDKEFAFDTAEVSVDYGWVTINRTAHLLPVHSTSLMCGRGRSSCEQNIIVFRDHRQFATDSRILP